MIINSLVLIEGNSVEEDSLKISLGNAKQIVLGKVHAMGWILHVAADSPDYLGKALLDFSKVPGVSGVVTLALRT